MSKHDSDPAATPVPPDDEDVDEQDARAFFFGAAPRGATTEWPSQQVHRSGAPHDWTQGYLWERYHVDLEARAAPFSTTLSFSTRHLGQRMIERWHAEGVRRVWLPGAGRCALPAVLATCGFDVLATDISPTAVVALETSPARVMSHLRALAPALMRGGGALSCRVHDFRHALDEAPFDRILNIRALQGFEGHPLDEVAATHAAALKPGGQAYFDTCNVQGARRTALESALTRAGLFVPYHAQHVERRARLDATGLPWFMVLDSPRVAASGIYASDEALRQRDHETLRAIMRETQPLFEAARDEVTARLRDPDTKHAVMIYSTG